MTDQERRASQRIGLALVLGSLAYAAFALTIGFRGIGSLLIGGFIVCGIGLAVERRLRG
jgi:hypothetical protein